MSWIFLSILASLTYAIINILDKCLLARWSMRHFVLTVLYGIIALLTGVFILFFHGVALFSPLNILFASIAGSSFLLMMAIYFKLASLQEISTLIPLFYLSFLFVLPMDVLLFGNLFTKTIYLGIFLLSIGLFLITHHHFGRPDFNRFSLLMILSANILLAIYVILTKYLLKMADWQTVFVYSRIGSIFVLMPLCYFYSKNLLADFKNNGRRRIETAIVIQGLGVTGDILMLMAIAVGYASLTTAVSSIQPLFVLLFAVTINFFFPKTLEEALERKSALKKVTAIALIAVGVYLIS